MKRSSFAGSIGVHIAAIAVLVNLPGGHVPPPAPSEYRQKIQGNESKIVWLKFRKDLPEVSPPRKAAEMKPLRAESIAKQSIVSSPKDAPKRPQMVWTPAPVIAPVPLTESPNLLAIKAPELPPPPAKIAKAFVEPPAPARAAIAVPQVVPDAPLIQAELKTQSFRLPPKPYIAPPPVARAQLTKIEPLADAPQLTATLNTPASSLMVNAPKLPPRPFTAPTAGAGRAPSKSVAVDSPPLDAPSNSRDLNVAIVGLNPSDRAVVLPTAPSPAAFSAGAQLRPTGAASEGAGKELSVPDLFVRPPSDRKSDLIAEAYAAPTSSRTLRAAMGRNEPVMTVHVDPSASAPSGGATKVSGAPDARFNGRDVYLMAIQMPNLTSYSGSWLMWYSGRTARETGLGAIAAPVAHRKVDPKYAPAAVEEHVEGKVQLACVIDREGKVSSVELVRGADERLNQSAREALAKWEFYPATRNGEPVDVDVLVEIPFKLAPRVAAR